jgi:hypothetical protein
VLIPSERQPARLTDLIRLGAVIRFTLKVPKETSGDP